MTAAEADLAQHAAGIAARFGLGRPVRWPVRTARGKQGVVWRFDTDGGRFAVKQLLLPLIESAARLDAAFVEVAVDQGRVLAPRPVRTVDGDLLAQFGPALVRVHTWIDLDPAQPGPDPAAVGTLIAALHRTRLPADGPVEPWYVGGVSAAQWADTTRALTDAGAGFAPAFAEFAADQQDLQALLTPPSSGVQLCHRDLWLDNLPRAADGRICVVDWDNSGPAEPGQELAVALFEQGCVGLDRAARLAAAYRDAGGPGRVTGPDAFTMAIAQLGHFAIAAASGWLAARTSEERGRMEAWFREGYDEPLGRARIEALVVVWSSVAGG